jgi:hypothetical protein
VTNREAHRIERAIQQARFPVLKELADFEWNSVPSVPKTRILELAQGVYITNAEPIISASKPRLGEIARGHRIGSGRVPTRPSRALLQCGRADQ